MSLWKVVLASEYDLVQKLERFSVEARRRVEYLWRPKCDETHKVFVWKVMFGVLPTGDKIKARGIGEDTCCRCKHGSENLAHLVAKCPGIRDFTLAICKWTHKQLGIPFF